MSLRAPFLLLPVIAAACVGCATPTADTAPNDIRFSGRVVAVDLEPWTYDGSGVVRVQRDGGIGINVELPARWNLCRAPAIEDPAALQGQRVRVVARAVAADRAVVCESSEHRIERLP